MYFKISCGYVAAAAKRKYAVQLPRSRIRHCTELCMDTCCQVDKVKLTVIVNFCSILQVIFIKVLLIIKSNLIASNVNYVQYKVVYLYLLLCQLFFLYGELLRNEELCFPRWRFGLYELSVIQVFKDNYRLRTKRIFQKSVLIQILY